MKVLIEFKHVRRPVPGVLAIVSVTKAPNREVANLLNMPIGKGLELELWKSTDVPFNSVEEALAYVSRLMELQVPTLSFAWKTSKYLRASAEERWEMLKAGPDYWT